MIGRPVQVVIAVDAAHIEGVTRDALNEIVPDARIVLVPILNRRGPMTKVPTAVADSRGAYLLENVAPGDYRILALDAAGQRKSHLYWEDPDFLRQYERLGEPITVDPNSRMVINLETILLSD